MQESEVLTAALQVCLGQINEARASLNFEDWAQFKAIQASKGCLHKEWGADVLRVEGPTSETLRQFGAQRVLTSLAVSTRKIAQEKSRTTGRDLADVLSEDPSLSLAVAVRPSYESFQLLFIYPKSAKEVLFSQLRHLRNMTMTSRQIIQSRFISATLGHLVLAPRGICGELSGVMTELMTICSDEITDEGVRFLWRKLVSRHLRSTKCCTAVDELESVLRMKCASQDSVKTFLDLVETSQTEEKLNKFKTVDNSSFNTEALTQRLKPFDPRIPSDFLAELNRNFWKVESAAEYLRCLVREIRLPVAPHILKNVIHFLCQIFLQNTKKKIGDESFLTSMSKFLKQILQPEELSSLQLMLTLRIDRSLVLGTLESSEPIQNLISNNRKHLDSFLNLVFGEVNRKTPMLDLLVRTKREISLWYKYVLTREEEPSDEEMRNAIRRTDETVALWRKSVLSLVYQREQTPELESINRDFVSNSKSNSSSIFLIKKCISSGVVDVSLAGSDAPVPSPFIRDSITKLKSWGIKIGENKQLDIKISEKLNSDTISGFDDLCSSLGIKTWWAALLAAVRRPEPEIYLCAQNLILRTTDDNRIKVLIPILLTGDFEAALDAVGVPQSQIDSSDDICDVEQIENLCSDVSVEMSSDLTSSSEYENSEDFSDEEKIKISKIFRKILPEGILNLSLPSPPMTPRSELSFVNLNSPKGEVNSELSFHRRIAIERPSLTALATDLLELEPLILSRSICGVAVGFFQKSDVLFEAAMDSETTGRIAKVVGLSSPGSGSGKRQVKKSLELMLEQCFFSIFLLKEGEESFTFYEVWRDVLSLCAAELLRVVPVFPRKVAESLRLDWNEAIADPTAVISRWLRSRLMTSSSDCQWTDWTNQLSSTKKAMDSLSEQFGRVADSFEPRRK